MSLPLIVIGAGGHARVLIDALARAGVTVEGVTDADPARAGQFCGGVRVLGDDTAVLSRAPQTIRLVNAIGSIGSTVRRAEVYRRFRDLGYAFASVIHPASIIAPDVVIGEGVQLMAGSVVQAGSRIGDNVVINTNSSVDHDCEVSAHVHIAPGATISGGVRLGEGVHVGTGATIIQGLQIGERSIIAAGAVVLHNVRPGVTVSGAPAREHPA